MKNVLEKDAAGIVVLHHFEIGQVVGGVRNFLRGFSEKSMKPNMH